MKRRSLLLTVSVCLLTGILLVAFTMPSSVRRSHANETNLRWVGAYVDGYPGWPRNTPALDNFAAQVGKMPAVVMYYTDWQHDGFTTDVAQTIRDRGATPMITWLPSGDDPTRYSLLSIINGAHDPYIHHFAQQAAAWGHPFFLRFAHEMNGNWYGWSAGKNGNTPEQYAAAWRHVHDIFQAEGANQYATWVWSPNIDVGAPYTPVPMQQFYPGDQYVDWTALDGYNWGYAPAWQSFSEVFGKSYQILAALSAKPIMIGEMAAADNDGTRLNGVDKGSWIRDAYLNAIPNSYPRIQGVIWFNEQKERLWPVSSSQGALNAYREVVASSGWNQSVPVSTNPPSPTVPASTPTYVPVILAQSSPTATPVISAQPSPTANLALNKPVTASGM